ncbi:hypothetical protein Tco_0053480 [Tanacetum coccineum]
MSQRTTNTPKKEATNVGNASKSSSMLKSLVTSIKKDNITMSNSYSALNDESDEDVENAATTMVMGKMDDLNLLYRAYIIDALSCGRMEKDKVHDYVHVMDEVGHILALMKLSDLKIELDKGMKDENDAQNEVIYNQYSLGGNRKIVMIGVVDQNPVVIRVVVLLLLSVIMIINQLQLEPCQMVFLQWSGNQCDAYYFIDDELPSDYYKYEMYNLMQQAGSRNKEKHPTDNTQIAEMGNDMHLLNKQIAEMGNDMHLLKTEFINMEKELKECRKNAVFYKRFVMVILVFVILYLMK